MKLFSYTTMLAVFIAQFVNSQDIKLNGTISAENNQIKNVADPTDVQDAVTKGYFDSAIGTLYNPNIRYEIVDGNNYIQVFSSGNVKYNLEWERQSTTLTISDVSHGLSEGDYVVVRNMSTDYEYLEVQSITQDSFTVIVNDSGESFGSSGAYIPAFKISNFSQTSINIDAPSNGNVQLNSVNVFYYLQEENEVIITTPSNAINNGAGKNNSLSSRVPPNVELFRVDGNTGQRIGQASTLFSTANNHNLYTISGGLDTFGSILFTLRF